MQQALESALAELVFGAPIAASDPEAIGGWLRRHGVEGPDARAILERGIADLLVYRSLVRGTLEEALEASIPRALSRLGPVYAEYFERFLRERGPRTHYLRDVVSEFLEYCAPLWVEDARVPPYLLDLARHEALHIQIAAAPPAPLRAEPAPLDLDSGLAFVEASRLVRYEYAVHALSEEVGDCTPPERRETHLFVYRSREHTVRYLVLSPLAASIVGRLIAGCSLRESLFSAAAEHAAPVDDALLAGAARVLSDLSEREAVLGPCRATAPGDRNPSRASDS
jgi:hypothetical protein